MNEVAMRTFARARAKGNVWEITICVDGDEVTYQTDTFDIQQLFQAVTPVEPYRKGAEN